MTTPTPKPIHHIHPVAEFETRRVAAEHSELRAVRADGKITIRGYAAVYDLRSEPIYGMFYEVVKPGAFARALNGQDDVRGLFDHDSSKVLGRLSARTLRLGSDSKGLWYEIDLPDTSAGRDLAVSIERRDITQSSFGFRKIKDAWREERTPDGLMIDIRELLEVELYDVSPVAFPAYEATEVAMRSAKARREEREAIDRAGATRLLKLRKRRLDLLAVEAS
jgi:uncharacterized protein